MLQGEVYDVAVDIRVGSPTFGEWTAVTRSSENKRQFYVPEGFAHGFLVTSVSALFAYKCTARYNARVEAGVLWNDPEIGIEWPTEDPILSEKDRSALPLGEMPVEQLPRYEPWPESPGVAPYLLPPALRATSLARALAQSPAATSKL